jgi:histidine triad (HIT) family protein
MSDCIFCKIRDGEIPAEVVYSDDACLAFKDIHPAAPVHVVVIPKEHIATLNDVGAQQAPVIGALFTAVGKVAESLGVAESGYRLVANCNADAGQEVFHIHFHLLGGRSLNWPPG